jgi:hypothetical protein
MTEDLIKKYQNHSGITYGAMAVGGVSVLLIGMAVNWIFSRHVLGSKKTIGDVASYANPFCWLKGFKGCTGAAFQSLEVLALTYAAIIALIFGAQYIHIGGITHFLFPTMPTILSACVALLANFIFSWMVKSKIAGGAAIEKWSTYKRCLVELVIGVSTVPLFKGLIHLITTAMHKK